MLQRAANLSVDYYLLTFYNHNNWSGRCFRGQGYGGNSDLSLLTADLPLRRVTRTCVVIDMTLRDERTLLVLPAHVLPARQPVITVRTSVTLADFPSHLDIITHKCNHYLFIVSSVYYASLNWPLRNISSMIPRTHTKLTVLKGLKLSLKLYTDS